MVKYNTLDQYMVFITSTHGATSDDKVKLNDDRILQLIFDNRHQNQDLLTKKQILKKGRDFFSTARWVFGNLYDIQWVEWNKSNDEGGVESFDQIHAELYAVEMRNMLGRMNTQFDEYLQSVEKYTDLPVFDKASKKALHDAQEFAKNKHDAKKAANLATLLDVIVHELSYIDKQKWMEYVHSFDYENDPEELYMRICVYAYMRICVYAYMRICVYAYKYTLPQLRFSKGPAGPGCPGRSGKLSLRRSRWPGV